MQILEILSAIIILAFCVFLIGLGIVIIVNPQRAGRFLKSYASSARAHYTEQVARLTVGGAMVIFSPSMWYSDLLNLFGWILIITSVGLLLIPWQWHHKFGEWAIPLTLRYMKFYALGAFVLGIFFVYALSRVLFS